MSTVGRAGPKSPTPFEPGKVEKYLNWAETLLAAGEAWHPFFNNAYAGGGFTVGAGYNKFVSPYNTIDARGSITVTGYNRLEVEFIAPNLRSARGIETGTRRTTGVFPRAMTTSSPAQARSMRRESWDFASWTVTGFGVAKANQLS